MQAQAIRSPAGILADLWALVGLEPAALARVGLIGAEPALPSSFRVGAMAQASIAAAGLAAAEFWRSRGGAAQDVTVDMRHAAAEFLSERLFTVDGASPPTVVDRIWGMHRCGDGRWVHMHTHFERHRRAVVDLLQCSHSREAVAAALASWRAQDFEDAAAEAGAVVAMVRRQDEWEAHPQCAALDRMPLILIEKVGEAPPRPLMTAERPLGGVRVVDMTRMVAGPVAGRTLAAHGADVMRVTAPHLPFDAALIMDVGRGKLSSQIDLREEGGRAALARLLESAHVVVQGYRPGAIARFGFGPDQAAAIRPGIVYVSLSAFGHDGPWAQKRGYDSIVQAASGIKLAESAAAGLDDPKPLPSQALDHASGYLLALGAIAALMRQAREGGSWHVRVALARTGRWLQGLGRLKDGFDCAAPTRDDVADLLEETESGFGRLSAVRHAAALSETPPYWARSSMPLGSHAPHWRD